MSISIISICIMILSITKRSNAGRRQTVCTALTDAHGCESQSVQLPQVECSGFESCASSPSIVSKRGANSEITCSGRQSCMLTTLMTTTKAVYCQGYESCLDSEYIQGQKVQCSGAYSCHDVAQIIADTLMYCGGYKSCEKAVITAGKEVNCDGYQSCTGAKIESEDNVLCQGTRSCRKGKINTPKTVQCSGDRACQGGKITASKVSLYGNAAGEEAQISSDEVEAFGSNTLNFGEIDSVNRTKIRVKVSREAVGKDSTVICRDGSDCEVECVDGCEELELIQMSGSTSSVSVSQPKVSSTSGLIGKTTTTAECDTDYSHAGNATDGCPMVKVSTSDCEDRELTTYLNNKRAIIAKKILKLIEEMDDEDEHGHILDHHYGAGMEEIEPEIASCLGAQECADGTISDPEAECLGYQSCQFARIQQSEQTAFLQAYGSESVLNGDINTKGRAECDGKLSCSKATYFDAKATQCGGYESCLEVDALMDVSSIDCIGTSSCKGNIIQASLNVKCNANRACMDAVIDAGKSVHCEGHYGCANTNITSKSTVKCTGQGGCHKANVVSGAAVNVDGDKAASKAIIYASNVNVRGYAGLVDGTILSKGIPTVTIKMEGDASGKGARILCAEGSTCKLTCLSNACKEMDFYCLNNAECKVTPRECQQPRGPAKIEDIFCPNVIMSGSKQEDDELLNHIEQRKIEMMQDESYAQLMEKLEFELYENKEEQLNRMDQDIVRNIEISGMKEMNNGWSIPLFTWNTGILLGVIIFVITMIICYFGYNHLKLKHDELLYYQHLK